LTAAETGITEHPDPSAVFGVPCPNDVVGPHSKFALLAEPFGSTCAVSVAVVPARVPCTSTMRGDPATQGVAASTAAPLGVTVGLTRIGTRALRSAAVPAAALATVAVALIPMGTAMAAVTTAPTVIKMRVRPILGMGPLLLWTDPDLMFGKDPSTGIVT